MHRLFNLTAVLMLGAALVAGAARADDHGHDAMIKAGDLVIHAPWARATPGAAKTGAGYLTIKNMGDSDEVLVGGTAAFARDVEIHSMEMSDGVMTMFELDGGLTIPAGGEAVLEPGGVHVMFMGLSRKLVEGEMVPVTLTFQNAGDVELMVKVEKVGASGASHGHGTMTE